MFQGNWLLERLTFVIPLILWLSVHEWAHAFSAYKLGDDTAARQGRLTLNPLSHIDPIGTLLVPMMGIPFGWAKPVPVSPQHFDRKVSMRTGMMITAAAGPFSNLVLAVLCAVAMGVVIRFGWMTQAAQDFLISGIQLNVVLAVFNMLPIPPLDGSRVADGLMPYRFQARWERVVQYGPMLLLGVIVLPRVLGFSLFNWPVEMAFAAARPLIMLIATI